MAGVRFHINGCALLAACGLGVNLVWCTLMGHTMGFLSSATGIEEWVNPRLFFLSGILVISLIYLIIPRLLKRAEGILRSVLPLLAAFGTACFGMAYHQAFFDPVVLGVGGLFVAGICYFWLVARYILLLARTQGFVCSVVCVAGGLIIKLPVLLLFSMFAAPETQVAFAVVLPVVSALFFEGSCIMARRRIQKGPLAESSAALSKSDNNADGCLEKTGVCTAGVYALEQATNGKAWVSHRTIYGVPVCEVQHARLSKTNNTVAAMLVAIAAVVLAVIRSVSYLGVWGDTNANIFTALPWFTGIVIPAFCVVVFAYGALIRMTDVALPLRFQPALLLILAGLFVVAIQANPSGASLLFLTDVIQIDELCAHLLFWAVVVAALDVMNAPSYRVLGFGGAVYAAASIVWVLLLGRAAIVDTLLVMLATYALIITALYVVWAISRKRAHAGSGHVHLLEEDALLEESRIPTASRSQDTRLAGGQQAETPLVDTVSSTCLELARRYGLSPRETEVFILLAQGRTRAFIQEELVLSGSTVKTHVSHIYAKMDVHDRQEMMNLIWS